MRIHWVWIHAVVLAHKLIMIFSVNHLVSVTRKKRRLKLVDAQLILLVSDLILVNEVHILKFLIFVHIIFHLLIWDIWVVASSTYLTKSFQSTADSVTNVGCSVKLFSLNSIQVSILRFFFFKNGFIAVAVSSKTMGTKSLYILPIKAIQSIVQYIILILFRFKQTSRLIHWFNNLVVVVIDCSQAILHLFHDISWNLVLCNLLSFKTTALKILTKLSWSLLKKMIKYIFLLFVMILVQFAYNLLLIFLILLLRLYFIFEVFVIIFFKSGFYFFAGSLCDWIVWFDDFLLFHNYFLLILGHFEIIFCAVFLKHLFILWFFVFS